MNVVRLAVMALALCFAGCMNVSMAERRMQAFISSTPATGVDEFTQWSISPIWIQFAHAKDIDSRPDGKLHIGEATLTIISWLSFNRVKVVNVKQPATQRERAVYPRDPLTSK